MRGTVCDTFVGRIDELEVLRESLDRARAGLPRIVVIEGEPGVGKTAVLRRFVHGTTGVCTLWASGDEFESALEFGVATQLGSALSPNRAIPMTNSFAVGAQLLAEVGALEEQAPVVLVVDDLHWTDLASSRALLFLLRRLRTDVALVLLATRPRALERLGDSWARLLADDTMTRWLRLDGLSAAEVRELAAASGRSLAPNAGERLREHTAGNPLYVSALLAELSATALSDDAVHLPAPHSYAATVLAAVSRLSPSARELISAAAVIGLSSPLRVAAATAGVGDAAAIADEAVAAELVDVIVDHDVDVVRLKHPLVRAAIYDDLSPAHRQRLHLAAAGAVDEPSSLRHRIAATADRFDGRLAAELITAATAAQDDGALQLAADHLLAAARVDTDVRRADRAIFQAVELLLLAGDVFGAQAHASAVAARADSPYRRYTLALLATPSGQFARCAAELQSIAESVSPSQDPVLFGRSAAALAFMSAMLGDDEASIRWAWRAREIAGAVDTVDTMARQALAWSYAKTGRFSDALPLLADCSRPGVRPAAFETELVTIRGVVRNWSGQYLDALEDLRTVVSWVQLGYPTTDVCNVYASMAEADFHTGDWSGAATHAELAISLAEDLEHGWYVPYARSVATHLYAARGDDRFAATHADAAREAAGAGTSVEAPAYAALAAGHRAWGRSDWPAVAAALRPMDERVGAVSADHPNLALWRYRLAEAYLMQGQLAAAGRLLDEAPPAPWGGTTQADRGRLTALLQHRAGHPDRASAVYVEALAAVAADSRSLADGLLAMDYGRFLIESRNRNAAIAPLRLARGVLTRLGAARFANTCEGMLSACGAVSAMSAPEGWPKLMQSLTAKEQVVAVMVADGMTNREVAADLYLSVKAIEYHLGNIFAKLGIRSRRELRAAFLDAPGASTPRRARAYP
jgi:DNA-binding CsgD family transcriptional regulator